MRPSSRVVFSLVAIALLLTSAGIWHWSTSRSPKLATPLAPLSAQANAGAPAMAQPPAQPGPSAIPKSPAPATAPLRLIQARTPSQSRQAVENRWPQAQTLASAEAVNPTDASLVQRVRIIRTDFKYPLVRIEELVRIDRQSGSETLLSQVAMVADHAIVKLAPAADQVAFTDLVTKHGGTVRAKKPASKVFLVTIPAPLDPNGLPDGIDRIQSAAGIVTLAEPDFIVHATVTPNDPSLAQLWGLHNTGQTGGAADADIDAPEAWDISTGSREIVVGVIDTGIDHTHPDLAANMWTNPAEIPGNGIDDDLNGYIDDVRGWDFVNEDNNPTDDHYHGTHCAGTIGAVGNNSTGVVGVAHEVSLVALKFLSSSGSGTTSDAVEAVSYATALNLNFTSNSWGGGGYSQALYDAIAAAGTAGHLFIAAAGNDSRNTDTALNYPSCYALDNIISVAATDHTDALASFSNYGAATVDLGAPGVSTYSTSPSSSYRTLSGTSMATPHVAGAAAVVLAHAGQLTPAELKAALLGSVDLKSSLSGRTVTGGRLNLAAALALVGPADPLRITAPASTDASGTIGGPFTPSSFSFTLTNTGTSPLNWSASDNAAWVSLSSASGSLAPGANATVTATITSQAQSLTVARHNAVLTFTNVTTSVSKTRSLGLQVLPFTESIFTEGFEATSLDPARWTVTGTGSFRTQVTTSNGPRSGTRHLTLDASLDNGVYARNEATLTLDLSGRSELQLSFWAKTFSDEPDAPPSNPFNGGADFDGLAVSVDGNTWFEIQPLRDPVTSGAWQKFTIDLDAAFAARGLSYGGAVRFRFNQYDNYAISTDGLAIDDIAIERVYTRSLVLNAPASLSEASSSTSATLTANPVPASDLVVSLSSSRAGSLSVPASVTIPAGQNSVTFNLTPTNDTLLNGSRNITVSAVTTGWGSGTATIRLDDNESATLALSLPASATEGAAPLTATLTASAPPAESVSIPLTSSAPTEATVPASVTLPAGQTSVTFPVTIVDDNRIDGSISLQIVASVPNWTSGSASLVVHDNENNSLALTVPSGLREGQGNATASVQLSGVLASPLTVVLSSNDTTEITVPSSVILPAGQTSVSFPLTIVDDTLADGPQTVLLRASATGFATTSATLAVADNDLHHFTVDAIGTNQVRNAPFTVALKARDISGAVIPTYAGTVSISVTNASGTSVPFTPSQATNFTQGVWSGPITITAFATGVTLVFTESGGRSVTSNTFNVGTGPLHHLAWDPIPSSQQVDTPFTATVRAYDSVGNPLTDVSASLDLACTTSNGTVEVLSWTRYADLSTEYPNTKAALSTHFTRYNETSTSATTASALQTALAGKHVFLIPEQESAFSGELGQAGTTFAPVLQSFVNNGGVIIACSWNTEEHLLLSNAGLLVAATSSTASSYSVTKSADTDLNAGVATPFTGSYVHAYSGYGDAAVSLHLAPAGAPVVLSRPMGLGRTVLIGTDFYTTGTGFDRVLANAVASANSTGGTSVPVRAAPASLVNGVWTGTLAVPLQGSSVRLIARTATGESGTSAPITVSAATPPAGNPSGVALSLSMPAQATEGASGQSGTLTAATAPTSNLSIALAAYPPAKINLPSTVVLPAGQTSVSFTFAIPDDTLLDGPRTLAITANAAGHSTARADLLVLDDETATVTLTGSASVAENVGSVTFTAHLGTPTAGALSVTLSSSAPGTATVPATVTISAGSDRATFSLTPIDDFVLNGARTLTLSATLPGSTPATLPVQIIDNETGTLSVSPGSITLALPVSATDTRSLTLVNGGTSTINWGLLIRNPVGIASAHSPTSVQPGPSFVGTASQENPTAKPAPQPPSAPSPEHIHTVIRSASETSPIAPAFSTIPLETILANLNATHDAIRSLIPSRYAFSEGVTGNNINDGGNDMYDGGNHLGASLSPSSYLAYSDNTVVSAAATLGAGGRYFTRKLDGLFVFAADVAGLSYFEISGNLGADGSGSTDSAVLTASRGGITYKGFVKRVYNAYDPSVNHLVIVADNGSVSHDVSTDTNNDYHRVTGLGGVTRIYYLLYASASGGYIDNAATSAIFSAFLDAVGTPDFVSASPVSGALAPTSAQSVTLTFNTTDLAPGTYRREIVVSSNAAGQPLITVPVELTVRDRVLHHFEFDPLPAALVRGAAQAVRIRAVDDTGLPVVTFNRPLSVTATGTMLAAPVTASDWINGVWTGQITPTTYATTAKLTVDDDAGITGESSTFAVGKGPLANLTWDTIPSPQLPDTPFAVTVRASDAGGNALDDYTGNVALSALLPLALADTAPTTSSSYYPFAAPYGVAARQQAVYPASALGGTPRRLTGLALNVASGSGTTDFSQWTIRLKHTSRTTLSNGQFEPDGWTTVHTSTARPPASGWAQFAFTAPFLYDGTSNLLVEFTFRNATTLYSYTDVRTGAGSSLSGATSSTSVDPTSISSGSTSSYAPVIRFTSLEPVAMRPGTATLANGVWSGEVSVATSATAAQLRATSGTVSGNSNTFSVSTPPPITSFPVVEDWESNAFSSAWTITGTNSHRTQIRPDYTPRAGSRHLILDSSTFTSFSRNEATLTLDLAGRTGVVLSFWAKSLGEDPHAPATNPFTGGADFDGVAISPDGVTWYEVQPLRSPALTASWQPFTVNLDSIMTARGWSYTSTFRIRFNRYGNDYAPYDGIAIDDIAVNVSTSGTPTLTLPASVLESAPAFTATITLPATRPTDTAFALSSTAAAKLSLPTSVIIPAGQTSATFTATPINDTLFDGSRTVRVTATPPGGSGLLPGITSITLLDDDVPTPGLSISPASVAENGTAATATLTLPAAPAATVNFALASSDPTAATVPSTLTFAAGQTSATFLVTPVDDTKIDGPQTTAISASLGSSSTSANFTVTDNENTNLSLSGSTTVTEGGTGTVTVSISGTLTVPLTVGLSSANPAQLTVPATVTIPAGATSVIFTPAAVDDSDTDGSVAVVVTASATGFTNATRSITARDNDLHHFTLSVSPSSPQLANSPFSFTAYARTIDENSATYSGSLSLTAQAGATSIGTNPSSITFNGSSYSGTVSVNSPATGVALRVDDGAGHIGVSSSFNVTVGPINRFAFSTIASPQSANSPFQVTLSAIDSAGNVATSFNGTATLGGAKPTRTVGSATGNYDYPFGASQVRNQIIYLAGELGGGGRLTGLAFNLNSAPGSVPNLAIRLKHTSLSSYATANWDTLGWTTVYQGSPNLASTGWAQINFTTPFDYDGTSNLLVDISCNSSSNVGGTSAAGPTSGYRTLRLDTYGQADPLTWYGTSPAGYLRTSVPNLRFSIAHEIGLSPSATGSFVNGVWSGNVTVAGPSNDYMISATSGTASGLSNSFSVLAGGIANLLVTTGDFSSSGYRAGPFAPATYTWTLTNSSTTPLNWSASKSAAWLSVTPSSGTLGSGASAVVTASFAANAAALTAGSYSDTVVFFNQTNGLGSTTRNVALTVSPAGDLSVTTGTFSSQGQRGGPFTPSSGSWTLTNTGDAALDWSASQSASWLSLSPSSGTLASGANATVTVTLASGADALNAGNHTDSVVFANTSTGRGNATRTANLIIGPRAPVVVTPPPSTTTVPFRRSASLTVAPNPVDGPFTYQWYHGTSGDTTTPIVGGTAATLLTPPLWADTSYWVRITNSVGTTDSPTASVTVSAPLRLDLIGMGYNGYGNLGDGTDQNRLSPVPVLSDVALAAAGADHTLIVKSDGTLWAFGSNASGQLGDGSTSDRTLPVQIATDVVDAFCGHSYSFFLKRDGTLWAMGSNYYGQLGDGTSGKLSQITPILVASDVVDAAGGYSHSLFAKRDGTLWSVGRNYYGQLGNGANADRTTLVQIATGVVRVAAVTNHSSFIKADGTLWRMGDNGQGQLGDGTREHRNTPVQVASSVVDVALGSDNLLFIKNDRTLWGSGLRAALGLVNNTQVPVQLNTFVERVASFGSHTLFVKSDGGTWTVGYNYYGQIGDGSTNTAFSPYRVSLNTCAGATGLYHTVFLRAPAPIILTHPASGPAISGQSHPLSVSAYSLSAVTYQWYLGMSGDTSQPIPGANGSSYTPYPTANTSYWVRVYNTVGSSDSRTATLTVLPAAPVLSAEPAITGGTSNTLAWSVISGATGYEAEASPLSPTTTLSSGWIDTSTHTFTNLPETPWSYRARYRYPAYSPGFWQQTSTDDFRTGTTSSGVDATSTPGAVRLATSPLGRETFDATTTWSSTLFPSTGAGTYAISPLSTGGGPNTTPPLPINVGGDSEARLLGAPAVALTSGITQANTVIDAYLCPASRGNSSELGLLLRSSRDAGGTLTAYLAQVGYYGDSPTSGRFGINVYRIVNDTKTYIGGGYSLFGLTDNQVLRLRFSCEGSLLTVKSWKITSSDGQLYDATVPIFLANLTITDSTITGPGQAGLYVNSITNAGLFDDITVDTIPSASFVGSGMFTTDTIAPSNLARWGRLTYTAQQPAGTALAIDVLNAAGTVLASDVPSSTDLSALPGVASATSIRLRARLSTTNAALSPSLLDWQVERESGPAALLVSDWSSTQTSIQDATPPTLAVSSPTLTNNPGYTLAGTASDTNGVASLTVNGGSATSADAFVNWSRALTLNPGANTFTLAAADPASPANVRTSSFTVTYLPPDADADGMPDSWESAHGLEPGSTTGDNGARGDPDRDGLPNLLEYAFGLSPRSADNAAPYSVQQVPHPATGAPELALTYRRLRYPGALTYTVQTSSNLATWTTPDPAPAVVSVTPNGDNLTETAVVRIPLTGTRTFVRIEVDTP